MKLFFFILFFSSCSAESPAFLIVDSGPDTEAADTDTNTDPEDDAGDVDSDTAIEADAGDIDTDADTETDIPIGSWSNPAPIGMQRIDAIAYCSNLKSIGLPVGSWSLPTIDQLRTLIIGCPATAPAGGCAVSTSCTAQTCGRSADCAGCTAEDTCYDLLGSCDRFWSSTTASSLPDSANGWLIDFSTAAVEYSLDRLHAVRCIRSQ